MIVQANVAQPQIIQRPTFLDAWLGRLAQMGQAGGEIMKALAISQQAKASAKTQQAEVMKNALMMRTPEGVTYLKANGTPDSDIQNYMNIKERMPNFQHEYSMGVINSKGLPGVFEKGGGTAPSSAEGAWNAAAHPSDPGTGRWGRSQGQSQVVPSSTGTAPTGEAFYPTAAMANPDYGGAVDRNTFTMQTPIGSPAVDQINFLNSLRGNQMFSGSNPFAGQ